MLPLPEKKFLKKFLKKFFTFGVHHKDLVEWENQRCRVSPIFLGLFQVPMANPDLAVLNKCFKDLHPFFFHDRTDLDMYFSTT